MNGTIKGLMAGALVSAGALWAIGTMSPTQRKRMTKLAAHTAGRLMGKANELVK